MTARIELFAAASLIAVFCIAGGAAALEPETSAVDDGVSSRPTAKGVFVDEAMFALDLRYRYEFVDGELFEKDAHASTFRAALTYETGSYHGLFAGVVLETVTPIGNPNLYNNAGAGNRGNGVADRPIVADPEISEFDRAYIGYRGPAGLEVRLGRFGYILDNQRFVGIAPWRQNYRSYSGLSFAVGDRSSVLLRYAYFDHVHYNNGADPKLAAHLVNLSRDFGVGVVAAYGYMLDWDSDDRAGLSTATFGARFHGSSSLKPVEIAYLAEYARQSDYGNNPAEYDLDYAHLSLGVQRSGWGLQVGWELRDGDGENSVQTPLGTNHGKNGFADRMVVNPPEGSSEGYVRLTYDRKKWSGLVAYHDFQAALGDDTLGTELDLGARYTPMPKLSLNFKAARYWAESYRTDVTKFMVWAAWRWDAPGFRNSN
ncbi:MAG: hypothetical protein PVG92_07465 [Holophagae bacterium]|jgi:hypothetical protein